ncbi:hypothetical protein GCM10008967_06750 [Bacillus carboniphilus]|uniref:Flagellar protein FlgN n=1 Tax=Bacillus carboniphilus TaxID=86663 RepID=A0ABN0VW65_9BACI
MSEQNLQTQLETLLQLHKQLLEAAQHKTEIVKKGDMDGLQQLLKQEQKLILEIDRAEKERQAISGELVPSVEKPTLEDCLPVLSQEQQNLLIQTREELRATIAEIEMHNNLNYELIQQSLHYVHVSLNLFHPKQEAINYGPPKGPKAKAPSQVGMFQTKA